MLFFKKRKMWKVSWIYVKEIGYEGGGRYCQHNLTEEGASELFKHLVNDPEALDVTLEYDT